MERTKNDRVIQAQAEAGNGWTAVTPSVSGRSREIPVPVVTPGMEPQPEPAANKIPMTKPAPMQMPDQISACQWETVTNNLRIHKTLAPPPVVALPVDGKDCSYCVTLAMSYTPMQEWGDLYEAEEGFARGTIFAGLDLPFMGKGNCRYD